MKRPTPGEEIMKGGDVIAGKYKLVALVGRGGMGEVFAAIDLASGEKVAVKVVNSLRGDEFRIQRLEREALAAQRIVSPFVPQLIDVDRTEKGELFFVMELLQGEPLSRFSRGVSWSFVRSLGEDILQGLMDAHAAGVIHRDLKPANIFLEHISGGVRARILDFGVCKLEEIDLERLTASGESVGTIAYMAPEQIRSASNVDARADLYSFATVIFEAITGVLPYDTSGEMALLAAKLERPARRLGSLARVPFPEGLEELIDSALARNPRDRPSSAEEMLRLWRGLGESSLTTPFFDPVVARHDTRNRRYTWRRAAFAFVTVIMSSGILLAIMTDRTSTSRTLSNEVSSDATSAIASPEPFMASSPSPSSSLSSPSPSPSSPSPPPSTPPPISPSSVSRPPSRIPKQRTPAPLKSSSTPTITEEPRY